MHTQTHKRQQKPVSACGCVCDKALTASDCKISARFSSIVQSSGSKAETKKKKKKLTSVTMDALGTSLPFYENKCTSLMAAPIQRRCRGLEEGYQEKFSDASHNLSSFLPACMHNWIQPANLPRSIEKKKNSPRALN